VNISFFLISILLVFIGCDLFTNGIEWIGRKFKLSESVVGSILAAIGTALPETFIPIIAIFFVGGGSGPAAGLGAILGAPFMLSTLAMFVTGVAIRKRREQGTSLILRGSAKRLDLSFFLLVFLMAMALTLVPNASVRSAAAPLFIVVYVVYLVIVVRFEDPYREADIGPLKLNSLVARARRHGTATDPSLWGTTLQTIFALVLILIGAEIFVGEIIDLSASLGVNATVLALIIAPFATELPEKVNSVIWVRQGKDALALGNITGAMVFQTCIPVAFGIAFTPWMLGGLELVSVLLTFVASLTLYIQATRERLSAASLIFNGVFYFIFVAFVWILL
jgi:cation:H+ antiporter